MTVGAILPALNAAPHLDALIGEIKQRHPELRVVVIDDGSSDGTPQVARNVGAEVISHPENRGKGAALQTGFDWALAEQLTWVYTMDADGQHLPAEMERFLTTAERENFDVVVGNRMDATADMPPIRKATNQFTSWVISRLAGSNIPDSQNGFRLFRVTCLDGVTLRSQRYDAESEILVKLARRGYRIGSVPITAVYGEEQSSINPIVDTGRFFRLVWRLQRMDD